MADAPTTDVIASSHEGDTSERVQIDTIRTLSMDAVQAANSGHPGTPMALAPVGHTVWTKFLRYDPARPDWPNRDRFVLSVGHASMLLYALIHLAGVEEIGADGEKTGQEAVSLDDIRQFASSAPRPPVTRNIAIPPASRPRPGRSVRAAATRSAWRSRSVGWRRATIAPISRCSTTISTSSAAMAT
jgi:hypothetical protein